MCPKTNPQDLTRGLTGHNGDRPLNPPRTALRSVERVQLEGLTGSVPRPDLRVESRVRPQAPSQHRQAGSGSTLRAQTGHAAPLSS